MKKKYIIMLIVILSNWRVSFSQKELQINYSVINCETYKHWEKWAHLRADTEKVLFTEYELSCYESSKLKRPKEEHVVNQVYKNLYRNDMWCLEDRKYTVKEKMDLMKWDFYSDRDSILGYLCRKAKTTFRGRKYEAWFTTDLPFKAAPWKVHGLPGVVLKLQVDRDYYVLVANKISIVDLIDKIESPFGEKKSMNWSEYLDVYAELQKGRDENVRAMEIRFGRKYDWHYPKLEIIVEKNRLTCEEVGKRLGVEE